MSKTRSNKHRNKSKKIITSIIIALLIGMLSYFSIKAYSLPKVTKIFDGDTIVLNNKKIIRLYGVDAPEIGNCGWKEAKDFLTSKLLNKKVRVKTVLYGRGRYFGFAYDKNSKESINEQLLEKGLANYLSVGHLPKSFIEKYHRAKENHLGIFSSKCTQTQPPKPDCSIKGNISERKQKIYFLPNCRNYKQIKVELFKGEGWFCSEHDARKAGFRKSLTCPN